MSAELGLYKKGAKQSAWIVLRDRDLTLYEVEIEGYYIVNGRLNTINGKFHATRLVMARSNAEALSFVMDIFADSGKFMFYSEIAKICSYDENDYPFLAKRPKKRHKTKTKIPNIFLEAFKE